MGQNDGRYVSVCDCYMPLESPPWKNKNVEITLQNVGYTLGNLPAPKVGGIIAHPATPGHAWIRAWLIPSRRRTVSRIPGPAEAMRIVFSPVF